MTMLRIQTDQALSDRHDRPAELVASGHQLDMRFRPGQKALSLRAGKMWHLLVKAAGVDMAADRQHTIALADLYQSGLGHMTQAERIDTLRELQTTLVEVRISSPKVEGVTRVITEPLLARVERDEDDRGDLVWQFSRLLREVFASSDHWAVLSKRAVLAFESRYSLRLYEILVLRAGLDHKTSEIFDLQDLRSRLGVPPQKLATWPHLRQFALEPAIAEVNQLAGFKVDYEAIKRRRAVASVRLIWETKTAPERNATRRELDAPRDGRKARREGTVEAIELPEPAKALTSSDQAKVAAITGMIAKAKSESAPKWIEFPAPSAFRYSQKWCQIFETHHPSPLPDREAFALRFREWCQERGIPLNKVNLPHIFEQFCKRGSPAT